MHRGERVMLMGPSGIWKPRVLLFLSSSSSVSVRNRRLTAARQSLMPKAATAAIAVAAAVPTQQSSRLGRDRNRTTSRQRCARAPVTAPVPRAYQGSLNVVGVRPVGLCGEHPRRFDAFGGAIRPSDPNWLDREWRSVRMSCPTHRRAYPRLSLSHATDPDRA